MADTERLLTDDEEAIKRLITPREYSPLKPAPTFDPSEPGPRASIEAAPTGPLRQPYTAPAPEDFPTGPPPLIDSPLLRGVAGSAALNAIPPLKGAGLVPGLLRMGGQGAYGGLEAALEGRSPSEIAFGTGLGIVGQGAGEVLAPVRKGLMLQGAGRKVEEANELAKKTFLRDLADTKARNEAAELGFKAEGQKITEKNVLGAQAHAGMKGQWIERQTNQFMDALKKDIPEFKDLPKGSEGMKQYMFGKGYNIIHEGYDKAIQDLVGQAKGQMIQVSPETAAAFGLKTSGPELSPQVRDLLKAAGKEVPPAGYDAAHAITAITGKWKKNPDAYREVADALSEAGLVNPMSEKYKTAIGLQTFLQKSGAMKETGVVDPALLQKAFYDVEKVHELQRRGLGDVSSGKLQAFLGGPGAFKETPMPTKPIPQAMPREPTPTEVKYGPLASSRVRHGAAFALPMYAAHAMGAPMPLAAAIATGTAALGGRLIPEGRRVIEAPLSARQMELLRLLPILGGAVGAGGAREGFLGQMR
jgi:hypothetical protein